MTQVQAMLAELDAEEAYETALNMRLDIAALQDRYSETFSPEETAALNMLTARAMDRVKITMADANTPRSERLNLTPFLEKI